MARVETTEHPVVAETATFRPAGSSAALQAGDPAPVGAITVAPAITGQAGAFTPGAGPHDVDLLRDVLAPGEALALPAGLPAHLSGQFFDGADLAVVDPS